MRIGSLAVGCALIVGCSAAQPAAVGPLTLPSVSSGQAVGVSSARFFAINPEQTLSNAQLRDCRFGRISKIPTLPTTLEITPSGVKLSEKTLSEDALPEAFSALADKNREMAAIGCHPWRAGPEDSSMTPTLLIAADQAVSAKRLATISQIAARAGLSRQVLWVSDPGPTPRMQTGVAFGVQADEGVSVGALVKVIGATPGCAALGDEQGVPVPRGAPAQEESDALSHSLNHNIPVLPLVVMAAFQEIPVTGVSCQISEAKNKPEEPGDVEFQDL
ncbi:MAG: hypothetical protein AAFV53_18135 [Myxococcota bacterium]